MTRVIAHSSFWDGWMSVELMTDDGAGFARLSHENSGNSWFISDLYVSNDERNKGVARCIIKAAKKITMDEEIHYVLGGKKFVSEWLSREGLVCDGMLNIKNYSNGKQL